MKHTTNTTYLASLRIAELLRSADMGHSVKVTYVDSVFIIDDQYDAPREHWDIQDGITLYSDGTTFYLNERSDQPTDCSDHGGALNTYRDDMHAYSYHPSYSGFDSGRVQHFLSELKDGDYAALVLGTATVDITSDEDEDDTDTAAGWALVVYTIEVKA